MPALPIQIGGEFFREIRENRYCYVDKTAFIEELFSSIPPKVSLITRPRRFGKTLMMTMLRDFFDIQQDSKALFAGLAVAKNQTLCTAWMNQYPTVLISLKQIEGMDFAHAQKQYADIIGMLCADSEYLQQSTRVTSRDKQSLADLEHDQTGQNALENSLLTLCRALRAHWGKPVILLIDEYDVPLARAENNGYYQEMVGFLRNMLGAALKTNDSLKLAVLTGCLRISKESIFTGLNNFKCFGIADVRFADKFGFTAQEVDALLHAADLSAKKAVMKEWYDGYRFGKNTEIYCPWDILQYVSDLQSNASAKPQAYWNNTSGNALVRSFVGRTELHIGHKFENLLAGGCVEVNIVESLTYDSLHSSEDNLWSLLYLTGYLTTASPEQRERCGIASDSDATALVIPNREVREIFTSSIAAWFIDSARKLDKSDLFRYLWAGNAAELSRLLTKQLYATISYYDAHEDYYHAFLTGILSFAGYDVRSNRESGNGRPDILVLDLEGERAIIIEIKNVKSRAEMDNAAQAALMQIKERQYAEGLPSIITQIQKYGVVFCKKECLALKAEG